MRSVYDIAKDIAELAPRGGDTWQNVGTRQVPVRLLTELREAVQRERRAKVAWQADETDWHPHRQSNDAQYAGAWRFDG